MDISALISLYNAGQRISIQYPLLERQVRPYTIRGVGSGSEPGFIAYSRLTSQDADAVIDEEVEFFKQRGQEFEWKVYDFDQPPDLLARLQGRGFEIGEEEALMVLEIASAPPVLLQAPVLPPDGVIRRLAQPAQLQDVLAVQNAVWGAESFRGLEAYLSGMLQDRAGEMSIYVAYAGDRPVCAAWISFLPGGQFASLWGGSTVEDQRRQGWYTAMLAIRLQEARQRGLRFLTVDASPMSRPILEKHGFVKIGTTWPCVWHPEKTA